MDELTFPTSTCDFCKNALPSGWDGWCCPACALRNALELVDSGRLIFDQDTTTEPPDGTIHEFAGYEILDELGRGGMGVVYRARQRSLNRLVALKMILAGQLASKENVQRFRMEAEAAARLNHPNVLPVYEVGAEETFHYYTMRLLDPARPIGDFSLTNSPAIQDQRSVAALMTKVAAAVAFAHSHGILHRDLKPANVLVDASGEPYVMDFGLAKILNETDRHLTLTTHILGSPSYISPEQAAGELNSVSTATDIYGLGAILYELLTNRPPFSDSSALATLKAVTETSVIKPRNLRPLIHPDVEMICLKCLEKSPGHRYASALEVAEELNRFVRGEPIVARSVAPVVKLWRWAKRRPLLAVWIATAVSATIIGASGIVWQWRESVAARQIADQRSNALRENLYFSTINRIVNARMNHDFGLAHSLLESLAPSAGTSDFRGMEWGLLQSLSQGDELANARLPEPGMALTWTAEGSQIFIITNSGNLQIWDGQKLNLKRQHSLDSTTKSGWKRLSLSPDETKIVIICPTELQVLDTTSQHLLYREKDDHLDAAWSNHGHLLISKLHDQSSNSARLPGIWDLDFSAAATPEKKLLRNDLHGPIAVSKTGIAAAGLGNDQYRVWNLTSSETIGDVKLAFPEVSDASMIYHGWTLQRLALSPSGKYAAAAWSHPTKATRVVVHDPAEKQFISLDSYSTQLADIQFHPQESALIVVEKGAADFRRINFLLKRPQEFSTLKEDRRPQYPFYDDHCMQPDAALAAGQLPLALPRRLLTRSAYGGRTQFLLGHKAAVTGAVWRSDGHELASVSLDGTLRVWDGNVWHTGRIAAAVTIRNGIKPVMSLDGQYFCYLRSLFDTTPMVQNRFTGKSRMSGNGLPVGVLCNGTVVMLEPGGVFSLHQIEEDCSLKPLWQVVAPVLKESSGNGPSGLKSCAISGDERFVSGIADNRLFVLNVQTKSVLVGERLTDISNHSENSVDVSITKDGSCIAVTGYETRALIVDGITLKPLTKLENSLLANDISVCFSADGRLFTGCGDGAICQWNLTTGRSLRQWKAHADEVAGIAIHPSGNWIVSSSSKELKIWNSDGSRERCYFPVSNALEWLRFSKNGKFLFQSGERMALEGWDLE